MVLTNTVEGVLPRIEKYNEPYALRATGYFCHYQQVICVTIQDDGIRLN